MRRRWPWLLAQATVLAVVLAVGAWALFTPTPPPEPLPVVEAKASPEELCREWSLAAMAMADHLDRAFQRHAAAHRAYTQGKMPFGPADKPGTVLYVWKTTLHQRRVHAVHYRELRTAWRKACRGEEAS